MILKTVSRYSGVICSTASILRIPRSSPQLTVREINGLSAVLKGRLGSAIGCTLSDSQVVQELVLEPEVVDHLPHGRQRLLRVGADGRRQVVTREESFERLVNVQDFVVRHASTSRRAFSSNVGSRPGSTSETPKRS